MAAIGREQVLAFRAGRHQFERAVHDPVALAVLDLGVQVASRAAADTALAARLPAGFDPSALEEAWTHRGAPHLHRPGELVRLAKALWPLSDDDAAERLGRLGPELLDGGRSTLEAIATTAEAVATALAAVDDDGISKGELSAAVTEQLPPAYLSACRSCRTTHVNEQLLRLATLPGGGRIVPGPPPVRFTRLSRWRARPSKAAGTRAIVEAYLRLHGPARPRDAAGFVGTKAELLEPMWPPGLVEVEVEGATRFLLEDDLADLERAEAPDVVRLLPPWDPYLQARDRHLLVPGRDHQKQLWKILGNPGALLVGTEVVGTWRARKQGQALAVTVGPFGRLARSVRDAVADEAGLVAAARGLERSTVEVT